MNTLNKIFLFGLCLWLRFSDFRSSEKWDKS